MLHTMLKKWWMILLQGILMMILGIFIFKNPEEVLAGISLWFGIIILITGVIGIFGWFFSSSGERDTGSLIWSILSALLGIFVLTHLLVTMKVVIIIFGVWILITGFNLFFSGWSLKKENSSGWLLLVIGLLSIIAGIMMIANMGSGIAGVATILGFQVLLTGLALILLSVAKKMLLGKINRTNV